MTEDSLEILSEEPFACPEGIMVLDRGSAMVSPLPLPTPSAFPQLAHDPSSGMLATVVVDQIHIFRCKDVELYCGLVEDVVLDTSSKQRDKIERIQQLDPYVVLKEPNITFTGVWMNHHGDVLCASSDQSVFLFSTTSTSKKMTKVYASPPTMQVQLVALNTQWVALVNGPVLTLVNLASRETFSRTVPAAITTLCFCQEKESLLALGLDNGALLECDVSSRESPLLSVKEKEDSAIVSLCWPRGGVLALATAQNLFRIVDRERNLMRFLANPFHLQDGGGSGFHMVFHAKWQCFLCAHRDSPLLQVFGLDLMEDPDWTQWRFQYQLESQITEIDCLQTIDFHLSDLPPFSPRVLATVLGLVLFERSVRKVDPHLLFRNREVEDMDMFPSPRCTCIVLSSHGLLQMVSLVDLQQRTSEEEEEEEDEFVLVSEDDESVKKEEDNSYVRVPSPEIAVEERPPTFFSGVNEKPLFPVLNEKPLFSGVNEKPLFSGVNEKPLFSGGNEKPLFSGVNEKPLFSGVNEKPLFSGVNEKPLFPVVNQKPLFSGVNEKLPPPVSKWEETPLEVKPLFPLASSSSGKNSQVDDISLLLEKTRIELSQVREENARLKQQQQHEPRQVHAFPKEVPFQPIPFEKLVTTTSTTALPLALPSSTLLEQVVLDLDHLFFKRVEEIKPLEKALQLEPFPPCFHEEKYFSLSRQMLTSLQSSKNELKQIEALNVEVSLLLDSCNVCPPQATKVTEVVQRANQELKQNLTKHLNALESQHERLNRALRLEQTPEHGEDNLEVALKKAQEKHAMVKTLHRKMLNNRFHLSAAAGQQQLVVHSLPTTTTTPRFPQPKEIVQIRQSKAGNPPPPTLTDKRFAEGEAQSKKWTTKIQELRQLQEKRRRSSVAAVAHPVIPSIPSAVEKLNARPMAPPPVPPPVPKPRSSSFVVPAPPTEPSAPVAPVSAFVAPVAVVPAVSEHKLFAPLVQFYADIGNTSKDEASIRALCTKYEGGKEQELVDKLMTHYKAVPSSMSALQRLALAIGAHVGGGGTTTTTTSMFPPSAVAPVPFQTSAPPPPPPTALTMLTQFYQQFNPTKVNEVPGLLEKYRGREGELWPALKKKYPQSASFVDSLLSTPQQQGWGAPALQQQFPGTPQQQPSFGGFAPTTSTTTPQQGFGAQTSPPPQFGQFNQASGGFATNPSSFGQGFNAAQQQQQQQPGFGQGFGGNVHPSPSGFGNPPPPSGFGSNPTTPGGFGTFGGVAQSTPGGFGSFGGGGFGGFGGTAPQAFGGTAPQTTTTPGGFGTFGGQQQAGFGASPQTFAQPGGFASTNAFTKMRG